MEIPEALKSIHTAAVETQAAVDSIQLKYTRLLDDVKQKDKEIQHLRAENAKLREEMAVSLAGAGQPQREGLIPATRASEAAAPQIQGDPFRLERIIQIHDAPVHSVTMDNAGPTPIIATASWDATVKLYNLSSEEVVKTLGQDNAESKMGGLYAVAFAKTAPDILGCTSCDKSVYLWDHKKGTLLSKLTGHTDEVNGIDFHSSQQVVCTASDDCKVIIWDFQEGITLRTLDKHTKAVYGTAFLGQDNQYFVGTCCFDQKTRIFDMRDKQVVALLQTHTDDVIGIDYSSARQTLATGSDDGLICLWDTRNFKLQHKINTKEAPGAIPENEVKRVSFSLCGKRLAAACSSGRVLVYDLEGAEPARIADLGGHKDCVFDVSWGLNKSTGKRILVSASHDHTCRYWMEN